MATKEQCEKALRKQLKTKKDVLDISRQFRGNHMEPSPICSDEQFIASNIPHFLNQAEKYFGNFDRLGAILGIPSEAEQERQSRVASHRIAVWSLWIGLIFGIPAFVMSVLSLYMQCNSHP